MAKRRGGPPHEEHADESWLLPYSDMMTLLLAVFIVMFAVSSVDKEKFNAMMESMYTAFGGTSNVGSPVEVPGGGDMDALSSLLEGAGQGGGGLGDLYLSLNEYVEASDLSNSIDVQYKGDDVLVTLKNDVFFTPGSAELSPEMQQQAQTLAVLLEANQNPDSPFEVVVAGHTDNVPIGNSQYTSNWNLSLQRAANFLGAMLDNTTLNPSHFSVRGYGEYDPVSTNDTAEGRQKNRRVELLVSEKKPQAASNGASQAVSAPAPVDSVPPESTVAAASSE